MINIMITILLIINEQSLDNIQMNTNIQKNILHKANIENIKTAMKEGKYYE